MPKIVLDRVSGGLTKNVEKELDMARPGKSVWRGLCLVEEVRMVPLPDGRCEAVFVLRDNVEIAPEKDESNGERSKGKGGKDDD